MTAKNYDVAIIGAGLGGLSCGAYLSREGYKVLVLEQTDRIGGFCSTFKRQDYKFDAAVHFLEGGGKDNLFQDSTLLLFLKELGIEEDLELIRFKDNYTLIYPDGWITVPEDFIDYLEVLYDKFPREEANIKRFFKNTHALKNEMLALLPLFRLQDLATLPFRQPVLFKYRNCTFEKLLDEYFRDPKLKFYFSSLLFMFFGAPPAKISASLGAYFFYLLHYENFYYPKGGTETVPNALAKVIEKGGGDILLNQKVNRLRLANNEVSAVETAAGEEYSAKIIISGIDARKLFIDLIGRDKIPAGIKKKIGQFQPSFSFNQIWLGTDYNLQQVNRYSSEILYFDTYDFEKLFQQIDSSTYIDSFVVSIPTMLDPGLAPPGKNIIGLIAPARASQVPMRTNPNKYNIMPEYKKYKELMFDHYVKQLEKVFPGISNHILVKEVATPLTLARYTGSIDGAAYGWISSPPQFGPKAILPKTPFKNLYLTGHWTYPCGGILGAFYSGRMTAKVISYYDK